MKANQSSRVEEIAAVLRQEILTRQYRPGERLPSERDLATRFGANRGAVREALKKLEQMGIASINPGGVRVVPVEEATLDVLGHILDLEPRPDPALVGQVFEVLSALMAMSARTAIRVATPEQIDEMQAVVEQLLGNEQGDHERDAACWKELGQIFTRVNDNLVLRLILNGLKTQFVGRLDPPRTIVQLDRARNRELLADIDDGLRRADGEAVARAIRAHFDFMGESVTAALSQNPEDPRSLSHG